MENNIKHCIMATFIGSVIITAIWGICIMIEIDKLSTKLDTHLETQSVSK